MVMNGTSPMTSISGWPYVISASPEAPYRLLLVPPADFDLTPSRLMTLGRQDGFAPTPSDEPRQAVTLIDGLVVTYVVRFRRLLAGDFGLQSPMVDRYGRAIVASEGVVFAGSYELDPVAVLAEASDQIDAVIREAWSVREDDIVPRTSRPVLAVGESLPTIAPTRPPTPDAVPQGSSSESERVLEQQGAEDVGGDGSQGARFPGPSTRMALVAVVCAISLALLIVAYLVLRS